MAKNTPKTLTVILLLALAALSVAAVLIPEAEYSATGGEPGAETPPAEEVPPDTETPLPDDAGDAGDAAPPVEPFSPIPPEPSAVYAYTQTLWAEGGVELNAVHNSSSGCYMVVTHAGKEGALNTGGVRTVTVLKLLPDGTISALKHLAGGENYFDSSVTSEGLAVVTGGSDKCYVGVLSEELTDEFVTEMPVATGGKLFSLSEGFLLFLTAGERTNAYKLRDGVIVSSASIMGGSVAAVYDFYSYYLLTVKGIQGYSVVKLSPELFPVTTVTVPEKELLSITPLPGEEKQLYLIVERGAQGVEILKTDLKEEIERVGVGLAERAEAYMNGENIMLLLHSESTRLYMVDYRLNFTSSTALKGKVERIYDCISYDGGYKLLYSDGEALTLLRIDRDGKTVSGNFGSFPGNAALIDSDGSETVFYTDGESLKIIGV